MNKKELAAQVLLQQKLLPLYYHESSDVSVKILKALHAAGIHIVEYTHRGENALANFKILRQVVNHTLPGLQLGIGTIKNAQQCQMYVEAGADFIVCPSTSAEVATTAHAAGLLWIPGAMTPTEIAVAENAGATIVKIFPGSLLGPSYISSIKELFPDLKFMPTGGVEAESKNLRSWFTAGVAAVGMGSKLIDKTKIENKEYDEIKKATAGALALVADAATSVA